jgi:hypothetical protein
MKLTDDRRRAMFGRLNGCCPRKKSSWVDKAVKKFGTTEDFRKARWILPDGRMLDFYAGKDKDERQEHYLLGLVDDIPENELRALDPITKDKKIIGEYVQRGAIRFSLSDTFGKWRPTVYVEYGEKGMTPEQKNTIKAVISSHSPESIILEKRGLGGFPSLSKIITDPDSGISLRRNIFDDWEDKAATYFGTTEDFKRVGWILPDGRMLDFQHMEHALIGHCKGVPPDTDEDEGWLSENASEVIEEFVQRGALRFSLNSDGIYLNYSSEKELTPAQKERIKDAIKRNPRVKLFIDRTNEEGMVLDLKTIKDPDSSISLRKLSVSDARSAAVVCDRLLVGAGISDVSSCVKVKPFGAVGKNTDWLGLYRSMSQFRSRPIFWLNESLPDKVDDIVDEFNPGVPVPVRRHESFKAAVDTLLHEYGHVIAEYASKRSKSLSDKIKASWNCEEEFAEDFMEYARNPHGNPKMKRVIEEYNSELNQ